MSELGLQASFLNGDSVEILNSLGASGDRIDVLYLDSVEGPAPRHQEHQLAEIKAAYPWLSSGAVVLLDDDANERGKARLSRRWLESEGWKILDRQFQSVLVRGG
jgi:hypothetical protein